MQSAGVSSSGKRTIAASSCVSCGIVMLMKSSPIIAQGVGRHDYSTLPNAAIITTVTSDQTPFYIGLTRVVGIGPVRMRRLLEHFGSAETAWHATYADLID